MQNHFAMSFGSLPSPIYSVKPFSSNIRLIPSAIKATMYEILSIKENAGYDEIKKAYRKAALKWHPDACRTENKEFFTQNFIKAQEAYRILSDPLLREDYDYLIKNQIEIGFPLNRYPVKKGRGFGDWKSQLEELKRRSDYRDKSSWAGRMRESRVVQ